MGSIPTGKSRQGTSKSAVIMAPLAFILVFSFQNCGGKFEVSSKALSSLSCKPSLSKVAVMSDIEHRVGPVNCEDASNYSCTLRKYSPSLPYSQSDSDLCLTNDSSSCAHLKVLTFDTRSARDSSNQDEFLPGGEYNRDDATCSQSITVNGLPMPTGAMGEGANGSSALENAMASCRALISGGDSKEQGGVL